ncbi:MAG TPA: hypothetical protein GX401_06560 [Clostridiales bacterium]|nr:hypothetical protein [Clostridiales bacterium]
MTVKELSEKLNTTILAGDSGLDRDVTGCYIGDLLSWVMGRARENDAWITIMGNINAIGVAVLADTSCIILTENAPLDDIAREKANTQGIAVLTTNENSYNTAIAIYELLKEQ